MQKKIWSSNSQVLKRPLSEENYDYLGGAIYSPLVAEKPSWIWLAGEKKGFREPVRHVCSPTEGEAVHSQHTNFSTNYNTQRTFRCVGQEINDVTANWTAQCEEISVLLQWWRLSFNYSKLSLNCWKHLLLQWSYHQHSYSYESDLLWFSREVIFFGIICTLKSSNTQQKISIILLQF